MKVVIILGSKSDLEIGEKIRDKLKENFGIDSEIRIASAHKTPEKVLEIIKSYEKAVFVTVAGRSNALSGFVDANTPNPVIASPPISDKFAGMDILSSINMPSGVAPMLVLYEENAALAVAKIIALFDDNVRRKVEEYQRMKKEEVEKADEVVRNGDG